MRISLIRVLLLLLLLNFVKKFRLEMMYISLMESTRLSLIHLHGFQLFVCCHSPKSKSLLLFVPTNLLCQRPSLERLAIAAKRLLKLPNMIGSLSPKKTDSPNASLTVSLTQVNLLQFILYLSSSAFDKALMFA